MTLTKILETETRNMYTIICWYVVDQSGNREGPFYYEEEADMLIDGLEE